MVYTGMDPLTHKRRYIRETAKTYDAAEVAVSTLQRQVDEDRHPKTAITVRQAITQWLEVAKLEDTTRERYEDLIRLYILPTFGDMQAGKLDAELLERFYARLEKCREMCTGRPRAGHVCRPLSGSTTRKIHYIIRGALGRVVRWRHLGVNTLRAGQRAAGRIFWDEVCARAYAEMLIAQPRTQPGEWVGVIPEYGPGGLPPQSATPRRSAEPNGSPGPDPSWLRHLSARALRSAGIVVDLAVRLAEPGRQREGL